MQNILVGWIEQCMSLRCGEEGENLDDLSTENTKTSGQEV